MSEIKTNKISPRKGTTQTIGDSGDTVSIPCGVTTTNAGTISTAGITGGTIDNQGTITGLQGVINWDTTAKTANFNASSQVGYFVNTTSGAITVTFPASPTAGDVIGLKDYANTFDTNKLSIDPNGNNIQGSASNFDITVEGTAANFIYVDATRGWVLTDASKASDIAENITFLCATGGCISYSGNYKIHTFTGPGTFCVSSLGNGPTNPLGGPNTVDYLVIAGGAGGASGGSNSIAGGGGAGGAGGFRESHSTPVSGPYTASPLATPTGITVTATGYPITVGGGGAARTSSSSGGNPGSNSVFSTITSSGGGGGGAGYNGITYGNAANGGSGGGAGGSYSVLGTAYGGSGNTPPTSPPQGNAGGNISGCNVRFGAGGGGAGVAISTPNTINGGNGVTTSITGSPITRAGGGAGGSGNTAGGTGGSGGGGNGGGSTAAATSGSTNTGSGGGGSGDGDSVGGVTSGAGGSGIVIIRYKYQ